MKLAPSKQALSLSISLATLLGFGAFVPSAMANDIYWKGESNNWLFAKNWEGDKVPAPADSAVFDDRSSNWAGSAPGANIVVGAIMVKEGRTTPAIIQPIEGAVSTLTIHGVETQNGGNKERLLVSNRSKKQLSITNRAKGLALNIDLVESGVIEAAGPVNIGVNIRGTAGITKRGSGVLNLGDALAGASEKPEDSVGNTFSGDFIIEEGTVTSFRSSVQRGGALVGSPFGLGVVYFKGGAIRSTSLNPRHFFNDFRLQGNLIFGGRGAVNLANKTKGKTVLLGDTTVQVDNLETHFGQEVSGDYKLTKKGRGHLYLDGNVTIKELHVEEDDVRIFGKLTCEKLIVGKHGSISGSGQINCPNIVNPNGKGCSEFVVRPQGKLPVTVFVKKPSTYKEGNPILLLMHGADRRGSAYRKSGTILAEKLGMLLVCPEFDRIRFNEEAYQFSGIIKTEKGADSKKTIKALEPQKWTAQYLEPILNEVRRREGKNLPYYLVGHSAGAQFVCRTAAFLPGKAERIISVNPGSVLFPTRDQIYPYGFGGLPDEMSNDEVIRKYLAVPLTFYCGTADITSAALPVSGPSMVQGATRIERGRNIYAFSKKLAAERGWTFNWRLVEAQGVDHSSVGMWLNPNSTDAILGK